MDYTSNILSNVLVIINLKNRANTKTCPKCDSCIEKNGGCNHMTCRKCGHEFCWICMKNWSAHGDRGYECNKYKEDEDSKKNEAKSSLLRYLFHYERFMAHVQSLKLQDNLKEKVKEIIKYMQEKGSMGYSETRFLKHALQTLEECRNVLMNTYIFAFYIKKNNHLEMFENNQRDLEVAVEKLCSLLEQENHEDMDMKYVKEKVQNLTSYCDRRKQVLIDHVEEGFEKGSCWIYNEADCE